MCKLRNSYAVVTRACTRFFMHCGIHALVTPEPRGVPYSYQLASYFIEYTSSGRWAPGASAVCTRGARATFCLYLCTLQHYEVQFRSRKIEIIYLYYLESRNSVKNKLRPSLRLFSKKSVQGRRCARCAVPCLPPPTVHPPRAHGHTEKRSLAAL